jgi:esterase
MGAMSPRLYRQTKRRASAEATRQRIVEATAALHAERGIATTTMKDIAERADIGAGTLYNHFPTYDDVVRACGAHMQAITRPPDPEVFAGVPEGDTRIARLVAELFAYYARYPSFERARCDRDKLPVLAEAEARREQHLEAVVRAGLGARAAEPGLVPLVVGFTDFSVYRAITAAGASPEAAAAQVAEVLNTWLNHRGPTPTALRVAAGAGFGHHGAMTIEPLTLAASEQGEGPPVVILHGLFGSGANWTTVGRRLAASARVIAADLRNHGASPHDPRMDYPAMAADLAALIEARAGGRAAVVGHSMGGKAAMWLALTRPELVERLAVVDVAPASYRPTLQAYAAAMRAVPLRAGMRRAEADAALKDAIADPAERAFLLQNLRFPSEGAPEWRLNLAAIEPAVPTISAFPDPPEGARYDGPVLVISGERSGYVRPEHHATILRLFPRAAFVVVPGAGHWVHAEAPEPFLRALEPFLALAA